MAKPRAPLTIQRIQEAALVLIEQVGLEALSMRSLAKNLKVDPMAIYHHIPNKATLLAGVYESVLLELSTEQVKNNSWQEQLKQLLRRFRTLSTRHPKLFPGLIASSHTSEGIAKAIDTILGILLEAGLEPKITVQTGDTVFSLVTGFVLLELNHLNAPIINAEAAPATNLLLNNMERLQLELQNNQFAESFEFTLQFLVSGIEMQLKS